MGLRERLFLFLLVVSRTPLSFVKLCSCCKEADRCCVEVSGVGSIAAQMAKNVFGAKKVITTVSTSKVAMVNRLLGETVVDESIFILISEIKTSTNRCLLVVDYTKIKPVEAIELGSVDVTIDSIGAWFSTVSFFPFQQLSSISNKPF